MALFVGFQVILGHPVSRMLEAFIAFGLVFTMHQLGVEYRKGHREDILRGTAYAFVGTLIAFGVGIVLAFLILPVELHPLAFAIAAALSATDPVAVSLLMIYFRRGASHAVKKVAITLEDESGKNDPWALMLFIFSTGAWMDGVTGLLMALVLSLVIIMPSYILLRKFGANSRWIATTVRILCNGAVLVWGIDHGVALITMCVFGNYISGVLEANYHFEPRPRIDMVLFLSGTATMLAMAIAGVWIMYPAAAAYPWYAFLGGVLMVTLRLISRGAFIGIFNKSWYKTAFGGSSAIGVVAIATAHFLEASEPVAAAVLAGAGLTSIIVFVPLTYWAFKKDMKVANGAAA